MRVRDGYARCGSNCASCTYIHRAARAADHLGGVGPRGAESMAQHNNALLDKIEEYLYLGPAAFCRGTNILCSVLILTGSPLDLLRRSSCGLPRSRRLSRLPGMCGAASARPSNSLLHRPPLLSFPLAMHRTHSSLTLNAACDGAAAAGDITGHWVQPKPIV